MDKQILKDSGERRSFSTGAVRDRGDLKPSPHLISPHAQMREGMIHTLGSAKYDLRNWEKGMPLSVCLASAQRHIEQWKLGETDEDHIAQARWNLGAIIHFEEEIKAGRLPAELDDMPHYEAQVQVAEDTRQKAELPPIAADLMDLVSGREPVVPGKTPYDKAGELVESLREESRLQCFGSPGPVYYIAGPMRGIENFNFPAFDKAAADARAQNLTVISPAEQDRNAGIDPVKNPESAELAESDLDRIIDRDCALLLHLSREHGDGMILLPGWENSTGARAEVGIAIWKGLNFFDADDLLVEWTLAHIHRKLDGRAV